MDNLVDFVLRNLIQVHPDLFGPNSVFSSFEEDEDNHSGGSESTIHSGRIVYERDGANHFSKYLLLKQSARQIVSRRIPPPQTLLNEITFYTRVLPYFNTYGSIDHLFPKYYNSHLQYNVDMDKAVIVFEDLRRPGYRHSNRIPSLDYDHLKLIMRKLGEFHAYSYHVRQQNASQFFKLALCWQRTNSYFNGMRLYPHVMEACAKRGYVHLLEDPRYASTIEELGLRDRCVLEVYGEVSKLMLLGDETSPVHVLCHGDLMFKNVLFGYDENGAPVDMKMIDLATWRFASPALDLASVLYMSTDQQTRDEHWDSLIDEYYESLRSTFPTTEVPSRESILAEFKKRALFTFFIISFFLPIPVYIENIDPATENFSFESLSTMGGEEVTTTLTNVFKDMVDRDFL